MATRAVDARSRRYDPAETRQRVLEAANMLFSQQGFVKTGTADIARQADVSEGSIFYHFGSKRNLLTELGRMYGERMIEAMQLPGEDLADLDTFKVINRCFDYCAAHNAWENIMAGGSDDCPGRKGEHYHNPEAEPFYRASREVVVNWTERHLTAQLGARGAIGINIRVAASLTYAAVGDALDAAFAPGVTEAERDAIRDETARFVAAANGSGAAQGKPRAANDRG